MQMQQNFNINNCGIYKMIKRQNIMSKKYTYKCKCSKILI